MKFELHHGDCLDVLKTLADCSVDAIVTDPPAGIAFMGKEWDRDKGGKADWIQWMQSVADQCLRVIKPGGHALVWAIPRTSHWTGTAWEDAGWQPRDKIYHVFGSGFPKSLDVSKAIDKAAGAEREKIPVGDPVKRMIPGADQDKTGSWIKDNGREYQPGIETPATEAAKQWEGWGTALKPAAEEWWLFRKPPIGTIAANVLEHGTGGLNIDGCRVGTEEIKTQGGDKFPGVYGTFAACPESTHEGRFPANFIHDGSEEVLALFPETTSGMIKSYHHQGGKTRGIYGAMDGIETDRGYGDTGSAARFFYCAKASRDDRDEGCGISGEWLDSLELITHNDTFTNLKELSVWEIADQKAGLELNGAALPARVTFEAIASERSDSVLSTLSYGNTLTEKSLKGIRFTTSTGTSKIIDLKTLSWLTHLPTNGYTVDASKTIAEIGLSHAESAALQSLLKAITTNGETAFLLGASNAAKTTPLPTNAKEWLREKTRGNIHSTVKPTDLMRYLCRLITPPNGIVLDPFTGSGSTGKAAMAEGFRFIGIEREAEYLEIARARISAEAEKPRQLSLF
jgi:site-specific DNA-methyltransferase (adenine-specific)